jgi:hypothetical protein
LQLPLLTNLQALGFYHSTNPRESWNALSALSSLQTLSIYQSEELPACLPTLTQLEELNVYNYGDLSADDAAILGAALGQLHQLTCLGLGSTSLTTVPPTILEMKRLQRFLLWNGFGRPLGAGLPLGPWLEGLRWLGLTWLDAVSSVTALAAASQLERLVITGRPDRRADDDAGTWTAFWNFVESHPPLRCLTFHFHDDWPGSHALFDAVLCAARRRPALLIQRTDNPFYSQLRLLQAIPE